MDETTGATSPPEDRDARFAACLARLEELKAVKARREVLEERVFLEFLQANRGRINEFPLLETEQQSLMDMLLRRAEGLHPGHEAIKERLTAYLLELNHYGKARAVGDEAQVARLAGTLERAETVLAKVLQGAVYAVCLVKDNFSDAVIRHFGETSLVKIEEITATLVFDELYWRSYVERFIKEEVRTAYDDILADRRYRLSREGQLLIISYPFDAVLAKVKGTTKAISRTRVQTAYEASATTEEGRRLAETVAAVLSRGESGAWARRAEREELVFAARVAAMDVVATELAADEAKGQPGDEEDEARHAFRVEQAVGLALGAAVSLRVAREDFARALREFSPKETAWLVQSAGVFEAGRLGVVLEHIMELDFAYLLREKGEAEGGRLQVKTSRTRRASREAVEGLAGEGLSKIRRKQLFEDDPDGPDWLLFRSRTAADLQSRLEFLQIEPELARSVAGLWENTSHKVDVRVCINLAALDKVTTNLSARITEILGRYGIAPSGAAVPARTRRDA
jgi:hypothetical protein